VPAHLPERKALGIPAVAAALAAAALFAVTLGVQELASYHGRAGNRSTKHAEPAGEALNTRQGAS
jgi:hypothetical protein